MPHDASLDINHHDHQKNILKELNLPYKCFSGFGNDYGLWLIACSEDKIPWILLKTNGTIRERDNHKKV